MPILVPGWRVIDAQPDPSVVLVGEATLGLAERCAGPGGVLVLLEDLHWADVETCELIDYLSDKVDGTSIALVASVHTGEASHGERLAHTLADRRHAASILLRRLDDDDVEALMGASLGTSDIPAPLRDTVVQASGGVPLLVEEFLASLIDAEVLRRERDGWRAAEHLPALVPPSFAAIVADRLASLTEGAQRVLTAAAVIDDRIDSRLVALATGLDEAATIEGLREAVRCQLVDEGYAGASSRFRFHHGLGRAAVLDAASEPERRQLAKLALDALEADGHIGGAERQRLMGSLAVAAGDTERALRVLLGTAVAAIAQGACASARRAAELAAQLATSTDALVEVHEVLLNACAAAGDAVRAAEVGRRLLGDLARLEAEPIRVAQVHLRLEPPTSSPPSTCSRLATDGMEEARRLAEAAGALALVAVCDTHLSILHWLHFDLNASRACAQRALGAARRYQLGLLVPATAVMVVNTHAVLGRRAEVVEVFDRYLPMMDAEIVATQRGHVLALMALASEDRGTALEQLELPRPSWWVHTTLWVARGTTPCSSGHDLAHPG